MRQGNTAKTMRRSLVLCLAAALLGAVLMALPVFTFRATVYTKKSSNTFVGDEKYEAALAEAEEAAAQFRDAGMDVEISESVTERTNSKGETTSLVTFYVEEQLQKSVWSLLSADFVCSKVLRCMLVCLVLAAVCLLAGCRGSLAEPIRTLSAGKRHLRGAGCLLLLADVLLTPVLVFSTNYTFWRKVSLCTGDLLEDGKEEFYARIDDYLFSGSMGEEIASAVKGLTMDTSSLVWLILLCFLAALILALPLRFGGIKHPLLRGLLYAFIIVVCVITLYPYYVMLVTAMRSNAETLDMYFLHLLPTKWIWSNLADICDRGVLRFLGNSLIVAGGATALAMVCGIAAAYALARMEFVGRKFFIGFVIMSQMFSPVVLLIGISRLMNAMGLNDTLLGLIFINAAFNQAFAVWLLRGTFISIPSEMEQAARIDGCGDMGALIRVLLPMAAPGIVTALIFVFINAWNEYTICTILISTSAKKTITVGITQFSSFNMIEWQYLFAASLCATIPVVILFMCIEKHLAAGLTSGGVKG